MNLNQILIRPLLTEKTLNRPGQNQAGFIVQRSATKNQIIQAVETLFRVKVIKVRINRLKGVSIRTGRRRLPGQSASLKKAWVILKPGQTISFEDKKV